MLAAWVAGGHEPVEPGVVQNRGVADIVQRKVGMRGIRDDGERYTRLVKTE